MRSLALVLLLAGAVHLRALGHGFHYDDFHSLVHNPHIRSLGNIPRFFVDPTLFSQDPRQAMYRPLLLCTYALNYALGGLEPRGYHLVNLLLHAANAALLLLLAQALGYGGLAARTAAAFFVAQPLGTEVVHYVSSRSESLMALGVLASALAYVHSERRRWLYLLSLLFYALALASKSVAIAAVGLMPLCDALGGGWRAARRRWRRHLPFALVAAAYLAAAHALLARALTAPVRPLDVQMWTQLKAWVYYVWLAVVPVRLSVEHQFAVARTAFEAAACALLLLSLLLLARTGRRLAFALAWWALFLLPASVVPLVVLVNEHRLYLSLAGGGLALGWLFERFGRRRPRLARGCIAAYTIWLALVAFERGDTWASERALWADAAAKGPLMFKPHLRLGDALVAAGDYAGAERAYGRALSLRPHHPAAHNNLGRLYLRQGRLQEAEAHFRTVVESSPEVAQARLNLASLLLRRGAWQEAEAHYGALLERADAAAEVHEKLGFIALQYRGDPARALRHYEAALARGPEARLWVARGVALRALGDEAGAERSYKEALRLDPRWPDAWYNLGNLYRDSARRHEAREAYARAADLAGEGALGAEARRQWQLLRSD